MEEMQGIMTLPQSGAASAPADPQQEAVFQKLRQEVPPKQFGDELLGAASQADPQAVKAFVDELRSLEVPMDTLVTLNEMVDAILANPQDYARIRRQYMAQGIPEDVLPAQFDPMFFAALNMALDQLTVQQAPPVGMAGGGIADLAQYGRHGDTMLAHITPEEAALLKSRGGSGTINPVTGLPEFFIKKLFKSIGNAVKKFAQSTIGRIVLPIALGFFLGPTAASFLGATSTATVAAVGGFVGGAGSALLRGESLGDALKQGAIGGVTAGAGAGIMGGAEAFTAGSYTGPTTIGGQFDRLIEGAKTLVTPAQATQLELPSVQELAARNPSLAQPAVPTVDPFAQAVPDQIAMLEANMAPQGRGIDGSGVEAGPKTNSITDAIYKPSLDANLVQDVMGSRFPPQAYAPLAPPAAPPPAPSEGLSFQESMTRGPLSEMAARPVQGPTDLYREAIAPPGGNAYAGTPPVGIEQAISPSGNMPPPPPPGTEPGFIDKAKKTYDKYMPEALGGSRGQVTEQGIKDQLPKARRLIEAARPDLANAVPGTREAEIFNTLVGKKAVELATPGMLSTYAPVAALGAGLMYAGGAFEKPPATVPQMPDMMDPKYARPLQFGGLYGSRGYSNIPRMPVAAAEGGIMALEMGGTTYPRKQGHIKGPGTGTSDSIPALLSDGEFVFTAKSVRNLGNGSRRKGAKRLYAMMKMLEERKV